MREQPDQRATAYGQRQRMKIAIVGAGIGGLTTALALKRSGQEVTVYESATAIKPVGAGILMANNAMQVFDKLGVREPIEQAGYKVSRIRITDAQFSTISASDLDKFERKYGVHNVAIHRADLQRILAEAIGLEHIHLSKRLSRIEKDKDFRLTFADGTTADHAVLIGADGIRSTVRNQLFGTGVIRDTQQRCWRGVCAFDHSPAYAGEAWEAWGKGKRFGFVRISTDRLYWYAVINARSIQENASIADLFQEFHPDVRRIIVATPPDRTMFSDIIDLKPIQQWHAGPVCLIGDAAHATTPNMGQGACQAVEDAYVIGKLFAQGKSPADVFAQYAQQRMRKAHFIVNTSWSVGKLAHLEHGLAIRLRNTLLRALPHFVQEKQLDRIFTIYRESLP